MGHWQGDRGQGSWGRGGDGNGPRSRNENGSGLQEVAISNSTASRHGTRRGAGGVGPGLASSLWRWHCHHCGGGLQHTVKGVRVLSVSLIWSQTRWPSALCLPFDPFPVPVGRARAGRSQFSVALSLRAGALCGGGRPGSSLAPARSGLRRLFCSPDVSTREKPGDSGQGPQVPLKLGGCRGFWREAFVARVGSGVRSLWPRNFVRRVNILLQISQQTGLRA